MKIITTADDLMNYVDTVTQSPEREEGDVAWVTEAILALPTCPAWGADWEEFLRTLPWTVWTLDRLHSGDDAPGFPVGEVSPVIESWRLFGGPRAFE